MIPYQLEHGIKTRAWMADSSKTLFLIGGISPPWEVGWGLSGSHPVTW